MGPPSASLERDDINDQLSRRAANVTPVALAACRRCVSAARDTVRSRPVVVWDGTCCFCKSCPTTTTTLWSVSMFAPTCSRVCSPAGRARPNNGHGGDKAPRWPPGAPCELGQRNSHQTQGALTGDSGRARRRLEAARRLERRRAGGTIACASRGTRKSGRRPSDGSISRPHAAHASRPLASAPAER